MAGASPIVFPCPTCGRMLRVGADAAGKKARCPKCTTHAVVPFPLDDSPAPRPATPPRGERVTPPRRPNRVTDADEPQRSIAPWLLAGGAALSLITCVVVWLAVRQPTQTGSAPEVVEKGGQPAPDVPPAADPPATPDTPPSPPRVPKPGADRSVPAVAKSSAPEVRATRELVGHDGVVLCVALSADGTMALSGAWGGEVILWRTGTGEIVRRWRPSPTNVRSVAFTNQDKTAVVADGSRELFLFDVGTGNALGRYTQYGKSNFTFYQSYTRVPASRDGRYVVYGANGDTIQTFDLGNRSEAFAFKGRLFGGTGHSDLVRDLDLTPDGTRAVSCSQDGSVRVWDFGTRTEVAKLKADTGRVAVSGNGRTVAHSGDAGVKVWDVEPLVLRRSLELTDVGVDHLLLTPDGGRVVVCGGTGELFRMVMSDGGSMGVRRDAYAACWDTAGGRELCRFVGARLGIECGALSDDGRVLVAGSSDKVVRVWQMP